VENRARATALDGPQADIIQVFAVGHDLTPVVVPGDPLSGVFRGDQPTAAWETDPKFVDSHRHGLLSIWNHLSLYGESDVALKAAAEFLRDCGLTSLTV